jgi:pimeloyl-ACP methyl ester carboxylesterase
MSPTPNETPITSDAATICTQAFGEPSDPAVLLIMGQMASMLWWPEAFCRRLARAGRFVIRYDNRDTGRSTNDEPGHPSYGLDDLARDGVAVLDGHGIDRAHLVGMSLGGIIAQLVALDYPERVASVTAISTTPLGGAERELPGPDPGYVEHAAAFEDVDWSDRNALEEMLVRDSEALSGSRHAFDEAATRAFVEGDLARTANPSSLVNHTLLAGDARAERTARDIAAPVLVVHGSADPLFPHPHGIALAETAPAATLVTVQGGGHELHEGDWDQILEAVVSHTGESPSTRPTAAGR